MITAITGSIIGVLILGVAPTYMAIKSVDHVFRDMANKEKPIITIKFKDWSVSK